jgi:hypothetical protein
MRGRSMVAEARVPASVSRNMSLMLLIVSAKPGDARSYNRAWLDSAATHKL